MTRARFIVAVSLFALNAIADDAAILRNQPNWPTIFELNRGASIQIPRKSVTHTVKLICFEHLYEPDLFIAGNASHKTIREAQIVVEVDGQRVRLLCRAYQSPLLVNGLLIYVETTREWADAPEIEKIEKVERDVRFSAIAEGEPWGPAMAFPIRNYRWRSSTYNNTWRSLVPYNRLYYHAGEDLGAIPDRLEVVAPFAGKVVLTPLPRGDGKSNGVGIETDDGTQVRLAHMNIESIDPALQMGATVKAGQVLGKTGMTWSGRKSQVNDPHLHVGFKYGGVEGTLISPFPFFTRAYFDAYPDILMPMAGGYLFTVPDQETTLDGSRTLARPGRKVTSFRWNLSDGRSVDAPTATIKYPKPGVYSEELIVRADDGTEDRDYAQVRVWRPDQPAQNLARGWLHYSPVRHIRPGDEVTFWNRLSGTSGEVTIDFGDNTAPESIQRKLKHAYTKAGLYTVTLQARSAAGEPVTVRNRVIIDP